MEYFCDVDPGPGSNGLMSTAHRPPTTTMRKIRVWIRPARVGSTSDLPAAGPFEPLRRRPDRADPFAEALPGEVVGDLLGRDLESEEGVDTREVATECGRCRMRRSGRTAGSSAHLECRARRRGGRAGCGPLRCARAGRRTGGARRCRPRAPCSRSRTAPGPRRCRRSVSILVDSASSIGRRDGLDTSRDGAVPPLGPAPAQLLLPGSPHRGVGAADGLVERWLGPGPSSLRMRLLSCPPHTDFG